MRALKRSIRQCWGRSIHSYARCLSRPLVTRVLAACDVMLAAMAPKKNRLGRYEKGTQVTHEFRWPSRFVSDKSTN